jgi:hypothetical protein
VNTKFVNWKNKICQRASEHYSYKISIKSMKSKKIKINRMRN